MLRFDETRLVSELKRLARSLRVLFAAACAERQMASYCRFLRHSKREGSDPLISALEDVWSNPSKADEHELQRQLTICMGIIPHEDLIQPWSEEATYAQNAAMSVAYALRARISGEAQEAAWSARVAYESLDHFIISKTSINTNLPGAEQRVVSHPVIQAELSRQSRDIEELFSVRENGLTEIANQFRHRARAESRFFFSAP